MNYRLVAAAAILGCYAALAGVLFAMAPGMTEAAWPRVLSVFSAFGAMATAAASVLLGVEVQRTNVDAANARTLQATLQLAASRNAIRDALAATSRVPVSAAQATDDARLGEVQTILARAALETDVR